MTKATEFHRTPYAVELAESRAVATQLFYELSAAMDTLDRICQEVGPEWVLEKMPASWRKTMTERLGVRPQEDAEDDGDSEGDDSEVLPGEPGKGEGPPDSEAAEG